MKMYIRIFFFFIIIGVTLAVYILMESIASDIAPKHGETLIFPVTKEAPTLNPFLSQTGWEALITQMIYEGLAAVDPEGHFYPILAKELPTVENNGVSADGLTITWRLKEDIFWSDGQPFTAKDVKFTWEAVSHPQSLAIWAPGCDLIESIECPNDYTVVIKYSQYYPDYLGQFSSTSTAGQGILPKHACGEPSQMSRWECNRSPIGTGPFMLAEWKTGEYIKVVRNPLYHEEGKPFLDAIIFPIVPNAEVHKLMMMRGDADVWFEFNQQYIDELNATDNILINPGSEQWLLRLFLNLSERGAGDSNKPHPILADKHVRKAIQLSIDREAINEGVYGGIGTLVGHEMYHGPFTCPNTKLTFNPEAAKILLEEAGWVDTDGNGIREYHGNQYQKEGYEMNLIYRVKSGDESYLFTQQLITDMLLDVGIKVNPKLEESSTLNSLALEGNFDLLMWSDGYEAFYDPGAFLKIYYCSSNIPPAGWNITRFKDKRIDDLLLRAENIVDPKERHKIYCQIDQILIEEVPVIYLLVLPFPSAFSSRLHGWKANPNAILTWDAANWWLDK